MEPGQDWSPSSRLGSPPPEGSWSQLTGCMSRREVPVELWPKCDSRLILATQFSSHQPIGRLLRPGQLVLASPESHHEQCWDSC